MNKLKVLTWCFIGVFLLISTSLAQLRSDLPKDGETPTKFVFQPDAAVNVATVEELYAAVNNPANAGSQIVLALGVYVLSATDSGGAARPNGGRLELQENMSLRGVSGNRAGVVIDAINLPANSYTTPIVNTGAIRLGKGTNAVEWLTIRNAVNGGAGMIVHLSGPGTAFARIAHCVSTGNARGIDVRNAAGAASGFVIEAEIVDNDLFNNRISRAQGLRIINTQGVSGNFIIAFLSGNRIFGNQQGLLVENIGSTNGGVVSVYSSGDRYFENGGGATIGAALGPSINNTVNFTAVGSAFENNNGFTDFYRGGLNVVSSVSFQTPNGGSNNTANVTLRNCRLAGNQVADLAAFGASSLPVSIGPSGINNRTVVRLFGTPVANLISADSDPVNPAGLNNVSVKRNQVVPNSDYDGDGRTDLSVFRPSDQTWYLKQNSGGYDAVRFGFDSDELAPADFDGDGKTDIAVYRQGIWYLQRSQSGFLGLPFGTSEDIPVPADFDGDGKSEIAVWRPSKGSWYVFNLTTNEYSVLTFGSAGDKPLIGDFDGDGRADHAIFRPSNGAWMIRQSTAGEVQRMFGLGSDIPVPADYDGDGKTDIAVFRPSSGTWFIWQKSPAGFDAIQFGRDGDALVPADYDGDGKAEVAVFRGGVWYRRETNGAINYSFFGVKNDIPTNRVQ